MDNQLTNNNLRTKNGFIAALAGALLLLAIPFPRAFAQEREEIPGPPVPQAPPAPTDTLFIKEYRVLGTKQLPSIEVEEAVYPYLGPGRTPEDVEHARAALEKAYMDKGYQTVSVQIPAQDPRGGVVILQVTEAKVGRLRVEGSRFFSLEAIKKKVPSLAPGNVPNFNDVSREIVALNQLRDRRVTPVLKPGIEPGTVDIDLQVKDSLPLHGSINLNNRYIANTTPLRLNASLSYDNLWDLGHSIGGSFQIAPQRISDALIYSGYYIARLPQIDWLSFMVQGTKQDSDISTLGGSAVAGRGEIIGGRVMINLPAGPNYFHSLSFGMDYKHFDQDLGLADDIIQSPVTYYPFNITYTGSYVTESSTTELTGGVTFAFRGMGSTQEEFDNRRYASDDGFIYFRGELNHTHELPLGFQVYGGVQGQVANKPLVDSEEFAIGGLDTVRGYLEAEALGDNALVGSFEFRSPSLSGFLGLKEWRVYVFTEGGMTTINDPLPEQQDKYTLASIGAGSRINILDHLHGSVDLGVPLITQQNSTAGGLLVTFEIWADF
jgi:hemolysin activation/secretion protein